MTTLLVQSCSDTKKSVSTPTPALDVYDGYFYKIIKKAIREGKFRSDIDILILSAKHGLLKPDEKIRSYDRQMTQSRAADLRESVTMNLQELVQQKEYNRIVLNMAREYRSSIGEIHDYQGQVSEISGSGIGEKGGKLKKFIRGD